LISLTEITQAACDEWDEAHRSGASPTDQRWCFRRDDDGHNYLIPVELQKDFNMMLNEAFRSDDHDAFNEKFNQYQRDHWTSFTFTDPRDD
jgi:hypothetical protein